jgi:nucleotide-binding universal stress UspA family protein
MRLLMATGGAPHSDLALRLGAHLARYASEPPTVLTVIRREADRAHARATQEHACEVVKPEIPEVQFKIRVGHPADEIIREAEEGGYNLVIVGERPRHDLATRLVGSTAKRVAEHAPCPVIIARGKVGPVRRILLCDSGITSPSLLNRFTTQMAYLVKGGMDITLLHVMSQISAAPNIDNEQLRASAEDLIRAGAPEGELLARDIQILEQLNVHPRPKVRHGLVVEEIVAEAHGEDCDLVVIGAHRGRGWQRLLLDDLACQIIAHADRPVLVVR